eukprot:6189109-Pleurochrysis_carterae.AAC.3
MDVTEHRSMPPPALEFQDNSSQSRHFPSPGLAEPVNQIKWQARTSLRLRNYLSRLRLEPCGFATTRIERVTSGSILAKIIKRAVCTRTIIVSHAWHSKPRYG